MGDKRYTHKHALHLTDEGQHCVAGHVAKAVTDAELDRLVERLNETDWGKNVADTLTRWDHARRDAAAAITALRARIAEDQAQIAALTTYRENLRDEVIELRARIAELEAFQQQAIKQVCELAREAGEAKGKLEASELPGIVDGWREKCERLERRIAELEADRAEWVEVERLRMGKV